MEFLGGINQYLNEGEYIHCKGTTIGDLVEYLQQFPQEWFISVGGKSEPVISQCSFWTELTSIGQELEP